MITVKSDEIGAKFFLSSSDVEPAIVVYNKSEAGIINTIMITSSDQANRMSQALSIMSVFLAALNVDEDDLNKKMFPVLFRNKFSDDHGTVYSPHKIKSTVFSGNVVTVNKKERTKYEFVDFGFENGKLVINCKPVIW